MARGVAYLKGSRLLSIGGLPGIGKTEVALAIAHGLMQPSAPRFQRALWLDLNGITQVEILLNRIAFAWGLEPCEDAHTLARTIGTTALLLVLDNAEDLIRPAPLMRQKFMEEVEAAT